MDTTWALAKQISLSTRLIPKTPFVASFPYWSALDASHALPQLTAVPTGIVIIFYGQQTPRDGSALHSTCGSNQSMKPTAPFGNKFSVFATTPCRGLSLSR